MRVIKSIPAKGEYFKETNVSEGNVPQNSEGCVVNVFDDVLYQEILGFGGALTEAAAYNYSLMNAKTRDAFMKAYFDKKDGIGYNFGRTHINSCDFSLDVYSCVEEGDKTLETFNIERDKKYIIPFLKDALKYSGEEELILFASPWSPPAYMKDNGSMFGGGVLLDEYKELWAHFYAKYIKAYLAEGIKISAVTVQNEPKASQPWESCNYTPEDERDFIKKYLAPVFEEEGLGDIKIIIWDHNKERVYDRSKTILSDEALNSRVWAVGHHWYSGDHFDGLSLVHEQLHKPNICTEFCASIAMTDSLVSLAERYGREICECMNNYCIGICDWNVMLDEYGGPYHNRTRAGTDAIKLSYEEGKAGCYAPVIYHKKDGKMEITPIYYYIGHFSKYVKRGAKRTATTRYTDDLSVCAFLNPDGERVAVIMNSSDRELPVNIRIDGGECTQITAEAHSISTVLF